MRTLASVDALDRGWKAAWGLVAVGGAMIALAPWLPWFQVTAEGGKASVSLAPSFTGWIHTIAGLVVLGLAVRGASLGLGTGWRILVALGLAIMVGAAGLRAVTLPEKGAADAMTATDAERLLGLVTPIEFRGALDRVVQRDGIESSPAAGPWVAITGATLVLVGIVVVLRARPRHAIESRPRR
jgi:hypothetical protein